MGQINLIFNVVLCVFSGIMFGVAIEKCKVFEPAVLRKQMVFEQMIMLKFFLFAIGIGMFGLAILAMLPFTNQRFRKTCSAYYNKFTERGVLSSALGGLLHGIGMTICGACPVMLFVQVGAQVPNVAYTFAGALFGTLLYGILKPGIDTMTKPQTVESSNPWLKSPYFITALPFAVMFVMVMIAIELLYPWTRDVQTADPLTSILQMKVWPPYVSGLIVGSLQVPLVLGIGEVLGGSSSFITMLAQVLIGPLKKVSPFIAKHRFGFKSWWQILYVSGVCLGGYISASSSGYVGQSTGVSPTNAFIGSTILFLGARIAGGCTSGHGLSGMSFLSILSVIMMTAMFTGAITTALVMKQLGSL